MMLMPQWMIALPSSISSSGSEAGGKASVGEVESTTRRAVTLRDLALSLLNALHRLWTALTSVFRWLRRCLFSVPAKTQQPRLLHETSHLSGLRGIATIIIVLHDFTASFYPQIRPGYGSSPSATNILAAPIVRIWFSGAAVVNIFFITSGYALSIEPLSLLRQGEHGRVYDLIAPRIVRRVLRLYIPTLSITFVAGVLIQFGVLNEESPRKHIYDAAPSWLQQLGIWIAESLKFIALGWTPVSAGDIKATYGGHAGHAFEPNTWIVPVECRGGMMVFLTALGLAKLQPRARSAVLLGLSLFWLWRKQVDIFLFCAGMVCADVRLMYADGGSSGQTISLVTEGVEDLATGTADLDSAADDAPSSRSHSTRMRSAHLGAFAWSLWLLSQPMYRELVKKTPGYKTLINHLTPKSWQGKFQGNSEQWWPTLALVLLILMLDHAGPRSVYQRVLRSCFVQYVGKIGFGLYMLHGIVLYGFCTPVIRGMCASSYFDCKHGHGSKYVQVLLLTAVVSLPVMMWLSGIFTEVVDKRIRDWSKRLLDC